MKKKIRFLSALLALALCLSCMALPAFAEGEKEELPPPEGTCTCTYHCNSVSDIEGVKGSCRHCYQYLIELVKNKYGLTLDEVVAIVSSVCAGEGTTDAGGSANASVSVSAKKESAPDVSGHYRTTAECLRNKLKPAEIAQQQLYIDPVTNTIINLYDADGNLITATLSSDGHFYIVPDSSGEYVYIPTGF